MNKRIRKLSLRTLIPYILTVCAAASAFVVQFFFASFKDTGGVFLFFFPVVIVAAWLGGRKAGVIGTVLSASFIVVLLTNEAPILLTLHRTSRGTSALSFLQLFLFVLEGFGMSELIDRLRHTDLRGQFQKREREQAEIIKTLREQLAVSQEEVKARDEFLSIASHELKTPLTSMLLQLQTALHNIYSVSLANFSVATLLKMLESVESQTTRLSKMINDLLNVSLITTKRLDLEREDADLSKITKEVVENFSQKLEKEGYQLTMEAELPVQGKWDKVRMEQAITNLLSNAIKYGDHKPIRVVVSNHGGTGKVTVIDHGIGIPAAKRDKIFELFERAAPSDKYKGLGVGLFITDQIVRAHQGKIKVQSKENKGTTFTIELPLQPS